MTDDGYALARWIRDLEQHGSPPDVHPDDDTESLVRRFPHLAGVTVTDIEVSGPAGALPARLYLPAGAPSSAVVWVHGGGYFHGTIYGPEANWTSLELAARGSVVVSIEYRKALSGLRYPAPQEDTRAGWDAALLLLAEHGFAPAQVHLGGGSAGANLASNVVLDLIAEGAPLPASLFLLYPLVHADLPSLSDEIRRAVADAPPETAFTPGDVAVLSRNYVGGGGTRSVVRAFAGHRTLTGLPPTFILNAEIDALRASGELFGAQLIEAGVATTVETQAGITHGHVGQPGRAGTQETFDRLHAWIAEGPAAASDPALEARISG